MTRSYSVGSLFGSLLGFCALVTVAACGGDDKPATPPTGTVCLVNSDCNNPLSCSFGRCHASCMESRDCPTGQRCVKGDQGVNVCQLPEQKTCQYNTDCLTPLICARDLQCRNQCIGDRDCAKGQKCAAPDMVCADPEELGPGGILKNTIDGSVPSRPADAGAPDGGGVPDGGVGDAVAEGGVPDAAPNLDTPRMVPDADVPVEGVVATPATIRQGGSGSLVITAAAGLATAGDFAVEDVQVTPEMITDTMVKLSLTVKHGAKIGAKALSFTTLAGYARKPDVVTITNITAGPMGDDAMNRGTTDNPFRTLKRALAVATAGDTITLLDGTYRVADGETFMVRVPDKVTVEGQTAAGAQLIGPGETGGSVSVDGLAFEGDAIVRNLTVSAFRYGIYADKPNATITLENVKAVSSRSYNIYVYNTAMGLKLSLNGKDSDYGKSTSHAIMIGAPNVSLTSTNGGGPIGSLANGYGLYVTGAKGNVALAGFTFTENVGYRYAVYATAEATVKFEMCNFMDVIYVGGANSTLELVDSTVTVPAASNYGIDFAGTKLTLRGVTHTGSRYGVHQNNGAGEAVVRGSTFKDYTSYGYYLSAGKLDLGTATERGNNKFMGPDVNAWGLRDQRQSAVVSITSSNTEFNGFRPPAGKVTATTGVVNEAGRYYIQTIGNSIEFFEL